jgi:hypothetical protein
MCSKMSLLRNLTLVFLEMIRSVTMSPKLAPGSGLALPPRILTDYPTIRAKLGFSQKIFPERFIS